MTPLPTTNSVHFLGPILSRDVPQLDTHARRRGPTPATAAVESNLLNKKVHPNRGLVSRHKRIIDVSVGATRWRRGTGVDIARTYYCRTEVQYGRRVQRLIVICEHLENLRPTFDCLSTLQ